MSDKDDEDLLAVFGTEYEDLDDEKKDPVSRRPTAVHEEVATDTEGRRRFHGAFTGGFSAGYFNTVGSKEGWQPSEFKSSRNERGEKSQQRPEDFMDEEDLGEYGISSRRIRTASKFSSGEQPAKRRLAWEHESTTVSALADHLESMVRPVTDSVGVRMLRAMGWRQGRGVGLATVKEKTRRGGHDELDRDQLSKHGKGMELSAEDEDVIVLQSIEGAHGLGYTGLAQSNVLDQRVGFQESALKNKGIGRGIKGQAFGVGAFEEDDDNIYSSFDMSQYDFAIGGAAKPEDKTSIDARFVVSAQRVAPRKFYAPPRLPANFRPEHRPLAVVGSAQMPKTVKEQLDKLNPIQRARILGEDRINLMELVADKDRKRLEPNQRGKGSRWGVKKEEVEEDEACASRVVFPNEPMKQARFSEYLRYLRRGHLYAQPADMSVWEWENEKKEFEEKLTSEERAMLPEVRSRMQPLAKTALSMPLQELLQSKFVSEKGDLGKPVTQDEDKMAAVKMGFFGERTRTTHEWHPHKNLAKFFNVPHPYPGSHIAGCPHMQKSDKPKQTLLNLGLPNTEAEMMFRDERRQRSERERSRERDRERGRGRERESDPKVKKEPLEEGETEPSTSKEPAAEPVEPNWARPPTELFAAIFADESDSDDEEEEMQEKEDERIIGKQVDTAGVLQQDDQQPGTSGISVNQVKEEPVNVPDEDVIELEDEVIGPAPPPKTDSAISATLLLKYLKEDLKKEKEKKHKKHHKSKKDKKEKKSKKSKKHKKEKKSKRSSERSSKRSRSRRRSESGSESEGSDSTVTIDSD